MVVSKYKSNDPRTEALGTHLVALARGFARTNNVQAAVGGPEGSLGDLTSVAKSRIWLDVIVIAVALTLVLGLALRAVLLPAVATAFGLLVAAASFGVLQLLFGGPNPLLGGPGYLDPMSIIGIFTVAFGVTTTFSALLLMRTREEYVSGAEGTSAVRIGLRETGAAATGAGLVMVASLIPFLTTSFVNVQQFGIGVTVAVLLDVLDRTSRSASRRGDRARALWLVADLRSGAVRSGRDRSGAGGRPAPPRIPRASPPPPTRRRP